MFVVIGIGLATGVQLLMVALIASVIFNVMILTLARAAYAEQPRQVVGWTLTPRAAAHVETVLELCTKEWERIAATPQSDGRVRLEYRATLKKRTTLNSLRSAILMPGVPEIGEVTTTADT